MARRKKKIEKQYNQSNKKSNKQLSLEKAEALLDAAAELVIRARKGSISLLQHELNIDYLVAAELITLLEKEGILGPYSSTGPREVLIGGPESDQVSQKEEESTEELSDPDHPVADKKKSEANEKNAQGKKPVTTGKTNTKKRGKRSTSSNKTEKEEKNNIKPRDTEKIEEDNIKQPDTEKIENEEEGIDSEDQDSPDIEQNVDQDIKATNNFSIKWILLIGILTTFVIFIWPDTQTVTLHFKFNVSLSDLVEGDDGRCDIYINGKRVSDSNANGESNFDYTATIGDILKLTFKKVNYRSKSDTRLIARKGTANTNLNIHFESTLPKTKPDTQTVTSHFKFDVSLSDLVKGDDGRCDIYINGKRVSASNANGESNFDYTATIGDILKLTFKKVNYRSKSDTRLIARKGTGNTILIIHFESTLPDTIEEAPVEEKAPVVQVHKVSLSFHDNTGYVNNILLNGDSLTSVKRNGSYSWNSTFTDSENAHLEFRVSNSKIHLITKPPTLIYNVNRNISANVEIYGILDRPMVAELLVLNEKTKSALDSIEVNFSDANEPAITNEHGIINHDIQENQIGKTITINLNQKFTKFHSGEIYYTLTTLDTTTPDTIRDTVYCDIKYTVQLQVMDQNHETIKEAKVDFEGIKKETDSDGWVSFEVTDKNKNYHVIIDKDRFIPINTSVQPTGFVSKFPIEMVGTFGSIILIDSLQNEVTVPFIDILEDNEVLAQTNSQGKCTISVLLGESLDLYLKPLESSTYQPKKVHLTFERPNETKYIKIWPKHFTFNFNVTDDKGKKLKGVKIDYYGLSYKTNKNGSVSIKRYSKQLNPREEFEITYRYYKEKRIIPIISNKRNYIINHVIGTKVDVDIRTNPEKGNVRILDMAGNELINKKAPLHTTLDLGSYRFIAEDESGNSDEEVIDINGKPEEPIVLDMVNNIAIILTAYGNKDYQKVIQVYARDKSKIMDDLNRQEKYTDNRCEILRYIAKAHSFEKQYGEAQNIWQILIEDCEEKNPFFYNECASVFEHNENWSDAADMYHKARLYIEYLPIDKRPEFNARTLYKRADCMLNNYKQGKSQLYNPCGYLSEIKEVLNNCERSVNEGNIVNFPLANVYNMKTIVIEEEQNCE